MDHYAGIDVSLECSSVCIVDATGKIVREGKVASEPEALIAWFGSLRLGPGADRAGGGTAVAMALPGDAASGFAVELLETRHVHDAFKAMPVKSDRNDARGIAQLMRLGWFRPVHCKSIGAQETRAVLTARKLVQSKLRDVREQPARHSARLRPQGRSDNAEALRRPDHGPGDWSSDARSHRRRHCWPCMRSCCASSTASSGACGSWRARPQAPGC